MTLRGPVLGVACGITTFLVVGAVVIATLSGQYGESPGVGILGVFAGLVSGLLVTVAVGLTARRFDGWIASGLVAYGAVGTAFLAIAALRYVNVPGADEFFTFDVHLLASLLVAVGVTLIEYRVRARRHSSPGQ